ncbi:MAG: hypothetical protein NTW78_06045 [Campylobacterales bacterium]|nr:hypothetical protein [Campylobacterales bacterium]
MPHWQLPRLRPDIGGGLSMLSAKATSGSCKNLDIPLGSAATTAALLPNFTVANTWLSVKDVDPSLISKFPVQLSSSFATLALPSIQYSETVVTNAGVMVQARGTGVYTSLDGITWANTATLAYSNAGLPIVTDGTSVVIFCSSGATSTYSYRSTDFINWTQNASFNGESLVSSACYGNGKILCTVGSYGTASQTALISTNLGVSWSWNTLPVSDWWTGCAFANNMFMAAVTTGTHGKTACATSPDGVTWTTRTLPSPGAFRTLKALNGKFTICGGDSDAFSTSLDGTTWSANVILPNPTTREWGAIAYGNGAYVVILNYTAGTSYCISNNGIDWFEFTVASFYAGNISHIGNGVFFIGAGAGANVPSKLIVASVEQGLIQITGAANTYIRIRK